jgi:diacylglycerol kinase (CTP)
MSVTVPASMNHTRLKPRSNIHLARKIWHFLGVIGVLVIYHNVSRAVSLQLLILLGSFIIFVDILRHRLPMLNKWIILSFGGLMRDQEEKGMTGTSYIALGIFLTVALFPTNVVKLALLFLAVADPLASYAGIRYGKDRIFGNKTFQGSAAAFLACTIVAGVYFVSQNLMVDRLVMVSLLAGLIGAFSEAVPVGKLDDNLVMPVVSSSLLLGLYFVFGGLG